MTQPSILEWILIATMGILVLIRCAISIYKIIDMRKNPQKYKDKEKRKEEKLDE